MTRDIVIDSLRMAWFKRHPGKQPGLIFHSDRGSQYASEDFRDTLNDYGITASMSRRGNCWDNACSETLFGSLKLKRYMIVTLNSRDSILRDVVAVWRWSEVPYLCRVSDLFRSILFTQGYLVYKDKTHEKLDSPFRQRIRHRRQRRLGHRADAQRPGSRGIAKCRARPRGQPHDAGED